MSAGRAEDIVVGGTLDRNPLTDVLRSYYVERSTGQLVLTRLGEERTLWIDRGQVVSASSNREAQEVGGLLRTFGLADESILFSAFDRNFNGIESCIKSGALIALSHPDSLPLASQFTEILFGLF